MGAAAGPLLSLPLSCPVVWLRLHDGGGGGGIFEQWKTSMRIAAFGFLQLGFDCPRTDLSRVADLNESKSVRVANVTNSPLLVSKSGLKTSSSSSNSICRMHHELRGGPMAQI